MAILLISSISLSLIILILNLPQFIKAKKTKINKCQSLNIYQRIVEKITNFKTKAKLLKFFTPKVSSSNLLLLDDDAKYENQTEENHKKDKSLSWREVKKLDQNKILTFRFRSSLVESNSLYDLTNAIEGAIQSTYMFKQKFIVDFMMTKISILFLFVGALWPAPFSVGLYLIIKNGIWTQSLLFIITTITLIGCLLLGAMGYLYRYWYVKQNINILNSINLNSNISKQITKYIYMKKYFILGYVFILPITIFKELIFSWVGIAFAGIFTLTVGLIFVILIMTITNFIDGPWVKKEKKQNKL